MRSIYQITNKLEIYLKICETFSPETQIFSFNILFRYCDHLCMKLHNNVRIQKFRLLFWVIRDENVKKKMKTIFCGFATVNLTFIWKRKHFKEQRRSISYLRQKIKKAIKSVYLNISYFTSNIKLK